jgi:hypothetical protein
MGIYFIYKKAQKNWLNNSKEIFNIPIGVHRRMFFSYLWESESFFWSQRSNIWKDSFQVDLYKSDLYTCI